MKQKRIIADKNKEEIRTFRTKTAIPLRTNTLTKKR